MKILLIVPAYNEEKNILNTCKKIEEYKKIKEIKPDDNNNNTDDSTFTKILNQIINFITKYQIYIISALIVILIILVILIIGSKKKKRGVLE